MRWVERTVYLGVSIALAALCLYLLTQSQQSMSAAGRAEAALQAALSKSQAEVQELSMANLELQGRLTMANLQREQTHSGPLSLLSGADIAHLEEQGLREPVAALVDALRRQADLLPGTDPAFGPPEEWVISRHWILAPYHAGGGGGHVVVRFAVTGGAITFTRVDMVEH